MLVIVYENNLHQHFAQINEPRLQRGTIHLIGTYMVSKKRYFDNLDDLHQWNKSAGDNACVSPDKWGIDTRKIAGKYQYIIRQCRNSTQCFTCHIYGEKMLSSAEGTIWKAIRNLMRYVQLYHVVIQLEKPPVDTLPAWTELNRLWGKLLKNWRYAVDGALVFSRIASWSDNKLPHLHVIATSEPPPLDNLNYRIRQFGNTETDAAKLARYMKKNLRKPVPYTSKVWSQSQKKYSFTAWGESDMYNHVLNRNSSDSRNKENASFSLVRSIQVHKIEKPILDEPPPLKKCSTCSMKLPHTTDYFHMDRNRLKSRCIVCRQYENAAIQANYRAKHESEIHYRLTWKDIQLVVKSAQVDIGKWKNYYTDEIIDHWTIDHIVPLSRGGKNTVDNLCVTSAGMNSRKGQKTLYRWWHELAADGIRHPEMPEDMPVQKRLFDGK